MVCILTSNVWSKAWRQRSSGEIVMPVCLNEFINAARFWRLRHTPLGVPVLPEVKRMYASWF